MNKLKMIKKRRKSPNIKRKEKTLTVILIDPLKDLKKVIIFICILKLLV